MKKKYIPLLISFFSLIICVFCIIHAFSLHDKLSAAQQSINDLTLQKDNTDLQERIDVLTNENESLLEQLYALQNTSYYAKDDADVQMHITNDVSAAIHCYIDRSCSSQDIAAATKAAYDNLKMYCTDNGFAALVPASTYEALGNLPSDGDYTYQINQWADDINVCAHILSDTEADACIIYRYKTMPEDKTTPITTKYVMHVDMHYDLTDDTWQIDTVHEHGIIQSENKK